MRRLLVFTREPKQWIMIVGPFCFVIIIAFLIFALIQAIFVTVEDIDEKPEEPQEDEDDDTSTKAFKIVLGALFPILLNFGFCVTAGVFLLQPVAERQS